MSVIEKIADAIGRTTGQAFRVTGRRDVGGGCINSAQVLQDGGRQYFVKFNDAARLDMFEAETAGLDELVTSNAIRAPRPIVSGLAAGQAYLVLEYLDLSGRSGQADARLGQNLAAMHRVTQPQFGWRRDNTIGSTAQINHRESEWVRFYREHRLRYQLELAARRGDRGLASAGEQLMDALPKFFSDYRPVASLLHGDLWSGNYGVLRDGTPVPDAAFGRQKARQLLAMLLCARGPVPRDALIETLWPDSVAPGLTRRDRPSRGCLARA